MGLPSQFILSETIRRCLGGHKVNFGAFTMILKQMNAKMKLDLFRMNLHNLKRTMVVGVDSIVKGTKVTLGLTASYS